MRATGIVRRIDDLGRVVVPKEIRKVLRIREGDPLEIYTGTAGEVILKASWDKLPKASPKPPRLFWDCRCLFLTRTDLWPPPACGRRTM